MVPKVRSLASKAALLCRKFDLRYVRASLRRRHSARITWLCQCGYDQSGGLAYVSKSQNYFCLSDIAEGGFDNRLNAASEGNFQPSERTLAVWRA